MTTQRHNGHWSPAKRFKAETPPAVNNASSPSSSPSSSSFNNNNSSSSNTPSRVQQLQLARQQLPVWRQREPLCRQLQLHSTSIVLGETGSGKSTQLPQLVLADQLLAGDAAVAVTQPRRVAAISLARRVCDERQCRVGGLVGYTVRFEQCCCAQTRLHYVTDGMLLREAIYDRHLRRYTCVILDEAHERTVHTDILFGILKKIQKLRRFKQMPELRLIVMSATMNVDNFSCYFNNAPVIYLRGRQFPVQIHYCKQQHEDAVFACLATAVQIHRTAPADRHILMFLTGQEEIDSMVANLRQVTKQQLGACRVPLHVQPLYAALPLAQQMAVFAPVPAGHRRLVVATNIAETSLTLPDIGYVIDCGLVKRRNYQPATGLEMLRVERISQAQAWQRAGRAGRVSAGHCYRVYTRRQFDTEMSRESVADIRRCNLAGVCLQLVMMGVANVAAFDFIDRPDQQAVQAALVELQLLSAVTLSQHEASLTELGRSMAAFPLDPKLARAILASKQHKCTEEVVTIVAMMSVDNVLLLPASGRRQEALAVRRKFVAAEGDMITLLNVFRAYQQVQRHKDWCAEHFLHVRQMAQADNIRRQLLDLCRRHQLPLGSSTITTTAGGGGGGGGDNGGVGWSCEPVLRSLAAGLFQNVAQLSKQSHLVTVVGGHQVHIHPSSSLFQTRPACVMFAELVTTTQQYVRCVSTVDARWLLDIAPRFFSQHKLYLD